MRQLLNRLKALEEKQKPLVHSMKRSIVQYAKDKKTDYYASVHAILQERISKPTEQFKNYVLSLLGDRDYEKMVEAVNKVYKSYTQGMPGVPYSSDLQSPPPSPNHRYAFPNPPVYHLGAPDLSPQLDYMQSTSIFPSVSPLGIPSDPATLILEELQDVTIFVIIVE